MKTMLVATFLAHRGHIMNSISLAYDLFPEKELTKYDSEFVEKRAMRLMKNVRFLLPSKTLNGDEVEFNFYNRAGDPFYQPKLDTIRFYNKGNLFLEVIVGKKTVVFFEEDKECETIQFKCWNEVGVFFRPAAKNSIEGLKKYHMNKQQLMNDQK